MAKKKKGTTLLLLVIAMILMLVVYFVVVKINDQKKAEEDTADAKTISLLSLKTDAVTELYYKNAKGEMTLTQNDGNWVNKSDKDFPVNQTNASGMLTAISSINAERKVSEKADDLEEFGLKDPSLIVTVTKEDGTNTTLTFGLKVPTADYYYVMLSGDDAIYTVSSSVYDSFDYSTNQMIAIDTAPSITAGYITYLSVDKKDSSDFLVTNNQITENDLSEYDPWDIEKPYKKPVVADTDSLLNLFSNFTALTFSECVDYHAKDLSKYGLDDPKATIYIKYYEESSDTTTDATNATNATTDATTTDTTADATSNTATDTSKQTKVNKEYKLYIGNTNKDGDYYVKAEGKDSVNLMSADAVEAMININAYDYTSKYVSLIDIASVNSIDIATKDASYSIKIKTKTTKDADGKEESTSTYYLNNKKAEESTITTFYQQLASLKTEAEATKKIKDSTPYLTITFHRNTDSNKEVKVEFIPYDDNYYLVKSNGIDYFLADNRAVEELVSSVSTLGKSDSAE